MVTITLDYSDPDGLPRGDVQAADKRAAPDHESGNAHGYVKPSFESIVQSREWQRRSQSSMKGSQKQSAESDQGNGTAKRQAGHDEHITEAEHSTPHFLPNSLDLRRKFCKGS